MIISFRLFRYEISLCSFALCLFTEEIELHNRQNDLLNGANYYLQLHHSSNDENYFLHCLHCRVLNILFEEKLW